MRDDTNVGVKFPAQDFEGKPLSEIILKVERSYICWALNASGGNKAQAAKLAGLTYQTFVRKLNSLNLRVVYSAD